MSEQRDSGVGETVGRGMAHLLVTTGAGKLLNFVAQIILGKVLLKDDFGVFAIASAISLAVRAFQDSGVRELLVQRGRAAYVTTSGQAFWLAVLVNCLAASLLLVCAPLIASIYGESQLTYLLWIVALWIPLGTPWSIFSARLSLDMRFKNIAQVQLAMAFVQHVGSIVFALAGLGAISFVLPLPLMAIIAGVWGFLITHEKPWVQRFSGAAARALFSQSKWIIATSVVYAVLQQGDYAILGLILPQSILGIYYFSYQIPAQIGVLLASSLHTVLLPAFVRISEDSTRVRDALLRALRVLALLGAPITTAVAIGFEPLETLLWGGEWERAVGPTRAFAFLFLFRLTLDVPKAHLLARGRFRFLTAAMTVMSVGLLVAAAVGGMLYRDNAAGVAAVVSVYLAAATLGLLLVSLRDVEVEPAGILGAVFPAWAVAVAAAAVALIFREMFLQDVHPAWDLCITAVVNWTLFIVGARTLLTGHIKEALSVLPASVAGPLRKALRV
jgi:O-antigen/teichoic acid export membrane protein